MTCRLDRVVTCRDCANCAGLYNEDTIICPNEDEETCMLMPLTSNGKPINALLLPCFCWHDAS